MFASSMVEGVGAALHLRHVCSEAVQVLLEYIYVRNFCLENVDCCHGQTVQILQDQLTLADQYLLPDLVEQCARSMVESLDASNA
eukprot:4342408-Alexandrium_andersonii.AAC.1